MTQSIKTKILLFIIASLIIFCPSQVLAQNMYSSFDWQWAKNAASPLSLGDYHTGADLQPYQMTSDGYGNVYIYGKFDWIAAVFDDIIAINAGYESPYYIVKYNSLGDAVWVKPLPEFTLRQLYSTNEDIRFLGYYFSEEENRNVLVLRTMSFSGDLLWEKELAFSISSPDYFEFDEYGGLYFAFHSKSSILYNIYRNSEGEIISCDTASLNVLQSKRIYIFYIDPDGITYPPLVIGGNEGTRLENIAFNSEGDVFIQGWFCDTLVLNHASYDLEIVYNEETETYDTVYYISNPVLVQGGNHLALFNIGSLNAKFNIDPIFSSNDFYPSTYATILDNNTEITMLGMTPFSGNIGGTVLSGDYYLLKIDSDLNIEWITDIIDGPVNIDYSYKPLKQVSWGNTEYLLVSRIGSDSIHVGNFWTPPSIASPSSFFVAGVSSEGNPLWINCNSADSSCNKKTYSGAYFPPALHSYELTDGGITVLFEYEGCQSIPLGQLCLSSPFPANVENDPTGRMPGLARLAPKENVNHKGSIKIYVYEDYGYSSSPSFDKTKYVELWGSTNDNPGCEPIAQLISSVNLRCDAFYQDKYSFIAEFNEDLLASSDFRAIDELYLLNSDQEPIGKIGFTYLKRDFEEGRQKEAFVILHTDLATYQQHPIESPFGINNPWLFPKRYKYNFRSFPPPNAGSGCEVPSELYQTSMLIPPMDDSGSIRAKNIRTNCFKNYFIDHVKPVVFVHGIFGQDPYWSDTINYWQNGTRARLRNTDQYVRDNWDLWEYYYPPDQAWAESGYLFSRACEILYDMYNDCSGDDLNISVVAHSMGGLVTRSYIENFAYNWNPDGSIKKRNYVSGQIDKVLFLGTPHHGSYFSNLLYWEMNLPNIAAEYAKRNDVDVPGNRMIALASTDMLGLNPINPQDFDPHRVQYQQISGTDARGIFPVVPNPLNGDTDVPLLIVSLYHSDGIVSTSSSSLLDYGVPLILLTGYNHIPHLTCPDCPTILEELGIGTLSENEKNFVPKLIFDYLEDGEINISTLPPGRLIKLNGSVLDFADELSNGIIASNLEGENLRVFRLDIGLPIVLFQKNEDGQFWIPRDYPTDITKWPHTTKTNRFRVHVPHRTNGEPDEIWLSHEWIDTKYNFSKGLFLYYGENNYSCDPFKEYIDNQTPGFYGYMQKGFKENVINPLANVGEDDRYIHGSGEGWHLPGGPETVLPVRLAISIQTPKEDIIIPLSDISQYETGLNLRWCRTTHTVIPLSEQDVKLLETVSRYDRDEKIALNPGSKNTCTDYDSLDIWLDEYSHTVTIGLDYGNNAEPTMELFEPDGNVIQYTDTNNIDIFYTNNTDERIKYYTIINPQEGMWKTRVNGEFQLPDESFHLFFALDQDGVLSIASEPMYNDSTNYKIMVSLDRNDFVLENKAVTVLAIDSMGTIDTIYVNDNGLEYDSLANDGIYTGNMIINEFEIYSIIAYMTGNINSTPFLRKDFAVIENISVNMLTEIKEDEEGNPLIPVYFSLNQNYPNPFNPSTNISFEIPSRSHVKLEIFNILGQNVSTLINRKLGPGFYNIVWNGKDSKDLQMASGIYLYRLSANGFSETKKMLLLK